MNTRIKINPNICHGNPVIRNTRVLVSNILADLAAIIYDEVPEEELTEQTTRFMGNAAREQLSPGEMLKFARQDAGLSQTKLAALAGVGNRSGIALMEAGTRPISDKMAERLAGHLMVSSEILKTSFYPRFTEILS